MQGEVVAVCGMDFEAAIARGPHVRVVRAAELGLLPPTCAGLISFGCAGALDPSLHPGDCLLPDSVITPDGTAAVDPAWRESLRRLLPYAHGGLLAGVDAPVCTVEDKARLRRDTGARAIDMESHPAALAARQHGLRFAALRVIVDPSRCRVPASALAALGGDGTLSIAALLRSLGAHPADLPALVRLAVDALAARRSLHAARALAGDAFALPRA